MSFLRLCLLSLLLANSTVLAAGNIELLALKHRPAAEIITIIEPLLEPGEAVTGTGYQLILKAPPDRLGTLRALVTQLDSAQKQLRFTLRRASQEEIEQEVAAARIEARIDESGPSIDISPRIRSTRRKTRAEDLQTVTGLEGSPVYISTGTDFPVGTLFPYITPGGLAAVPGVEYRQARTGFYARAQVNGNRVRVEIAPRREVLSPQGGGQVDSRSLVTEIQGRLGEWLPLGGTGETHTSRGSGITHSTGAKGRQKDFLWLRVEALPEDR